MRAWTKLSRAGVGSMTCTNTMGSTLRDEQRKSTRRRTTANCALGAEKKRLRSKVLYRTYAYLKVYDTPKTSFHNPMQNSPRLPNLSIYV